MTQRSKYLISGLALLTALFCFAGLVNYILFKASDKSSNLGATPSTGGLPGIYNTTPTDLGLRDGFGSALAVDANGRLLLSPSSTIATTGGSSGSGTSTDTLLSVTNRGAVATSSVTLYGGLTVSNETVTGTQTLAGQTKQGVLFVGNTGRTTTTNDGSFSFSTSTNTLLVTNVSSSRVLFDRGTLAQPGLAVGTNPSVGFFGAATGSIDVGINGVNMLTINGNGILPRTSILSFPSLGVDIGGPANIFANGYFGTVSSTALRLTGPSASVSGDSSLCRSATSGLVSVNSGATTCTVSSARFKHEIKSMDSSLDLIMSLRPVDYLRNTDNLAEHGLIAEEVEKVDKMSVFYETDGTTPRGVKYENLVPVLIRAIQDQQKEIDSLKLRVSPLEWLIHRLLK